MHELTYPRDITSTSKTYTIMESIEMLKRVLTIPRDIVYNIPGSH